MWAYLVYQPEYINAKRKMISFNIGKYEPDGRDVILSGRDASHCMSDDIIHETEQCFCMACDERQAVMGRLSEKKTSHSRVVHPPPRSLSCKSGKCNEFPSNRDAKGSHVDHVLDILNTCDEQPICLDSVAKPPLDLR